MKSRFSFIEAPVYQGQKKFGVALGPAFLRQCLADQGFDFDVYGITSSQSRKKVPFTPYEELSYLVEREVRRARFVFTAGGDHSLSIGSVQGLLRYEPDLKVIWVDAHGDINTVASSGTGSYHGMPLAFLLGEEKRPEEGWFSGYLRPENLIYFGVRDLDRAEKEYLDKKRITYYNAADVRSRGASIIRDIASQVAGGRVHLSVDADAFDPMLAPSTGVPVADGLNEDVVHALVERVQRHAEILSYEYVELNPQIFGDPSEVFRTAQIGIDILQRILTNKKTQGADYGFHDRHRYAKGADLLHRSFGLEKQG